MDIGKVFSSSASVLKRNIVLAVPPIVASAIGLSLALSLAQGDSSSEALAGLAGAVLNFMAHGVSLAMAKEAIEKGTTSLSTGAQAAVRYFFPFLTASVIISLLIGLGSVLLIPGLIAAFLLFFTFPSIVVEGTGPFSAMKMSVSVIKSDLKNAAVIFIIITTTGFFLRLVSISLNRIPNVGYLMGVVLSGAFGGFVSTMLVMAYMEMRGAQGPPTTEHKT